MAKPSPTPDDVIVRRTNTFMPYHPTGDDAVLGISEASSTCLTVTPVSAHCSINSRRCIRCDKVVGKHEEYCYTCFWRCDTCHLIFPWSLAAPWVCYLKIEEEKNLKCYSHRCNPCTIYERNFDVKQPECD